MIIIPSNCASAIPTDPYWPQVSLLVKDIGINGATNNSFYDDGPYKFLPARTGDVTQGSFSPFGPLSGDAPPQIGAATYFDGTGDYLTLASNAAFSFGTGDFTVEFWMNLNNVSASIYPALVDFRGNGTQGAYIYLGLDNGNLILYTNSTIQIRSAALVTGVWYHVALARSGTTTTLYLNGVSAGSISDTTNYSNNGVGICVNTQAPSQTVNGLISNLRFVKGSAVYTAAFKPPAAPLTAVAGTSLLTCQSASAITDASSNAFTVTKFGDARAVSDSPFGYGSVYFDGSGDYLTLAPNSAYAFGTGDFTVECWVNPTAANSNSNGIWQISPTSYFNALTGLAVYCQLGGWGGWAFVANGNYYNLGTSVPPVLNTWSHLALVRASGTTKLYLNGVAVYTLTDSTNYTGTYCGIGSFYTVNVGNEHVGYISNFRAVKGTALYTTNFTPSTAPLTAISGTSLLTCQDKGSIVDASTNSFAVSRVGDARPVGMTPFAQKQAGYWSNYFDGSGDYLTVSGAGDVGTGDFCAEAWVFPVSKTSTYTAAVSNYRSYTTGSWAICVDSNDAPGKFSLVHNPGGNVVKGTSSIKYNQWSHVAMVRSSGVIKLYVNGVSEGTPYSSTTNLTTGENIAVIGSADSSSDFNGYVSNVRIVKGSPVYTADFTPPVAPLTPIANTTLLSAQDNRFRDNSSRNATVTKFGDVSVSRLNPFGPTLPAPTVNLASAGSVYFDGTGDYLSVPSNSAFQFGTSDFTAEFWWNGSPSGSYTQNIGTQATNWDDGAWRIGTRYNSSDTIYFARGTGSGFNEVTYAKNVNDGAWHHIACIRSSGTISMYVDGIKLTPASGSESIAGTCNAANSLLMGYTPRDNTYINGYMSNVRVVKGTAVYTSNFTPSTSPLTAISGTSLLTAQDAVTVTDASSNNFTVTKVGDAKAVEASPFKRVSTVYGGSGYFDGSGDYLRLSSNPNFVFGTGDFTIDFWVYPQSTAYQQWITSPGNGDRSGIAIGSRNGKFWWLFGNGSAWVFEREAGTMVTNTWYHVAVTRVGSTAQLYVNGVLIDSLSNSTSLGQGTSWDIGALVPNGYWHTGYISNVRFVKGVAVYTANFDPPVAPVSAVGGTSLLLNFDNAGIYDASGNNDMQVYGDTKTSTAVTKFSPGATTYFDGSGDYLQINPNPGLLIGTADFTVELWHYSTAAGGFWIGPPNPGSTSNWHGVVIGNDGSKYWYLLGCNGSWTTERKYGTFTLNTWNHVAFTRSSGTCRFFVNGIQVDTWTDAGSITQPTYWRVGGVDGYMTTGYLSDVRFTKGVARYTANFTPPAVEFPTRQS